MTQGHVDTPEAAPDDEALRVLNRGLRSGFSRRMAFWDAVKQGPKSPEGKKPVDPVPPKIDPPAAN